MKQIFLLITLVFFTNAFFAQSAKDEQEIRNLLKTMQNGWNNASGETFASAFTEPHDFIVWNGYYFKDNSIKTNGEMHQWIFNTMYKDTQLFYIIDKIKFLKEDIALLHVLGAVAGKNEPKPKDPEVLLTIIAQKNNENWKIVSFHNLDLEVFQDEGTLKGAPIPPSVMYASWYADMGK